MYASRLSVAMTEDVVCTVEEEHLDPGPLIAQLLDDIGDAAENADIADGKARMTAVVDAAVSRARPVGLGVLTTVLGVIPLLSDPFFKSLAVVIICGLSFATVLTLIVVPTLYAVFFQVRQDEISVAAEH